LTPSSRTTLGVLAAALFRKRTAEGREDGDGSPSAQKEMVQLIEKLNAAGVNLLQRRSNTLKAVPKPWTNPLDGSPLPPPTSPDERALLAKQDPELLRWFDELAKHPYKTLVEHNAAEAHAAAIDAIQYGPDQHNSTLNPFIPDERGETNLTSRGNFEKHVSPEVLDFYRQEAMPVAINLFGGGHDMSLRARLSRDPDLWAVIELGQTIDAQWRYDDKVAAEAARKAADETLKRLNAA